MVYYIRPDKVKFKTSISTKNNQNNDQPQLVEFKFNYSWSNLGFD